MGSTPQYTGYFSPNYDVQLVEEIDNPVLKTQPVNLTGVDPATGFELIMQNKKTGEFKHGIGTWTVTDAVNGKVSYQWTSGDLSTSGLFLVWVTVQLPSEPSPRAFDPDTITVVLLQKGAIAVATQDVNILEVNGAQVSSANPLPVSGPMTTADGGNVSQGAKADAAITDHTLSASEIALLKGIVKTLNTDGVKLVQSNVQSDFDTGAGTQNTTMFGIALPGSGGAVPGGTVANPFYVNDAPINTAVGSQSSAAITNPATNGSLISFIRGILSQLGFGQKTKDNSLSVTLASDQGNVGVSGSVTVNTISNYATENGNLAASKADLDILAGIVSGGKGAVKAGAGDFADLATIAGIVSSGKASVKAGSGDFVAGAIADLATYLTLAGAPGDANTVNSLMGRLTKLRDVLQNVAYDNTNEVKISNYGKSTAAGDTPFLLDSLGRSMVRGHFDEQTGLSAGILNADLVPSTDVSAYSMWSLHINTNAYSGTLSFQGSNDNVNWKSIEAAQSDGLSTVPVTTTSTNIIFSGIRVTRYLRIRMTSYVSGAAQGTLELFTISLPPNISAVVASQNGTWSVQPGNTQNTTPWLVAGPSNNAVQVANTAGNVVVKGSAGYLHSAVVTTLGTAQLDIYDNASTNAGTKLLSIPASAPIGSIYNFPGGARANAGIVSNGVSNCPGVTFQFQ